jgi:hypothetical protein
MSVSCYTQEIALLSMAGILTYHDTFTCHDSQWRNRSRIARVCDKSITGFPIYFLPVSCGPPCRDHIIDDVMNVFTAKKAG